MSNLSKSMDILRGKIGNEAVVELIPHGIGDRVIKGELETFDAHWVTLKMARGVRVHIATQDISTIMI